MITTKLILRPREMAEGEGARVKRLLPQEGTESYDPFVLLDEFFVDPSAGFPEHPHGGFEAVTYMREGAFRHRDNIGNDREVQARGVQRFTAGKGIVHAEMPGKGPKNHGFQLWINLPRHLKGIEPSYQAVEESEIPEVKRNGAEVRTLIGRGSPVVVSTEVEYQDITMEKSATYDISVPEGYRGLLYVYEGNVNAGDIRLESAEGLSLEAGESLMLRADTRVSFIYVAGRPHGEPIRIRGSFVE